MLNNENRVISPNWNWILIIPYLPAFPPYINKGNECD